MPHSQKHSRGLRGPRELGVARPQNMDVYVLVFARIGGHGTWHAGGMPVAPTHKRKRSNTHPQNKRATCYYVPSLPVWSFIAKVSVRCVFDRLYKENWLAMTKKVNRTGVEPRFARNNLISFPPLPLWNGNIIMALACAFGSWGYYN